MEAYRVWNFEDRKIRVVSYNFTICHEGWYPFKDRVNWPPSAIDLPEQFVPTIASILDPVKWAKYEFCQKDVDEVVQKLPLMEMIPSTVTSTKKVPIVPPADGGLVKAADGTPVDKMRVMLRWKERMRLMRRALGSEAMARVYRAHSTFSYC